MTTSAPTSVVFVRSLIFRSYCLAVGIASAAIYSVLVPISAATGLTLDDLNSGTGYMFLSLGWGCLIWQPIAQKFGKRPVYLLSLLGTMVGLRPDEFPQNTHLTTER